MEKTVKKLLNYYLTQYPITEYLELFKNIIFDDILKAHENEIVEKDRKINLLLTANKQITYSTKSRKYNQQQLYKEDFEKFTCFWNCCEDGETFYLKDNSKYYTLPSKGVK